jgi:hypothetical protein
MLHWSAHIPFTQLLSPSFPSTKGMMAAPQPDGIWQKKRSVSLVMLWSLQERVSMDKNLTTEAHPLLRFFKEIC